MCNFAAEEDYNYTLLRDGIIARNKVYGIAETTGSAVQLVPSAETKLFGLVARTASDLKRHIRKVDEIIQGMCTRLLVFVSAMHFLGFRNSTESLTDDWPPRPQNPELP